MLDEFFTFVGTRVGFKWVHWNMRDINYGFAAIEHRYRVLGGDPIMVEDSRKFDLSRLLISAYGAGYIDHPRLERLVDKNEITKINFLTGAQEAVAFEKGEFVKLHQSTLRKVDILTTIIGRAANGTLKTDAKWYDVYGVSPDAISEVCKEHWIMVLLAFLGAIASIVGLALMFLST